MEAADDPRAEVDGRALDQHVSSVPSKPVVASSSSGMFTTSSI